MPLVFSEGVSKGRLDVQKFVEVTATNAAKIYGIYPQKGTIAVGSDADIAIWDPDKAVDFSMATRHFPGAGSPGGGSEELRLLPSGGVEPKVSKGARRRHPAARRAREQARLE